VRCIGHIQKLVQRLWWLDHQVQRMLLKSYNEVVHEHQTNQKGAQGMDGSLIFLFISLIDKVFILFLMISKQCINASNRMLYRGIDFQFLT